MKRLQRLKRRLLGSMPILIFILLLAAGWEIGTTIFHIPHYIIPKLSLVFVSIWDNRELLAKHFAVTLWEALLGLGIAAVLGNIGCCMDRELKLGEKDDLSAHCHFSDDSYYRPITHYGHVVRV